MGKARVLLEDVEKATGHTFERRELLKRAMTHSSVSGDNVKDLERLEFLGDRVLGLLTAEALWRRYPDMAEGDLAPRLNQLVRKETCAEAARFFNLGDALTLSAGEENNGGRDRDAILGDAMEALLGALYIDGGLEAARVAWDRFWGERFDGIADQHRDPKTTLQEWAQAEGHGTPSYVDIARSGPDHAPKFTVEVRAGKLKPEQGTGSSKRDAHADAALTVLKREGVWDQA
ncbi:ribonuclease III [Parvularcula sp. ZS-1/3]|uniref:Ribonuclease 3 n=1 Tax=Parvularcula mediterranea TaxID=2732508 RepID=A0A7Y3RNA2_9PROT|nr:ribonuclease III [Parvularcula mediterranea]NNU17125.1 ribonuclease III [Parvularcula mediterranea]